MRFIAAVMGGVFVVALAVLSASIAQTAQTAPAALTAQAAPAAPAAQAAQAAPAAPDSCLGCHEKKTPGIVGYWKRSAHSAAGVGCVRCHGDDEKTSHSGGARVDARVCGSCHGEEYREHRMSKHAMGMKTGRGCTRNLPPSRARQKTCDTCHESGSTRPMADTECAMFLAQSPQMQRQGCTSCHRVERGCESCHTRHGTDTALAARAETCGTCHMGPDHAQYEMWLSSVHGVLYSSGQTEYAPTCVTCHMDGGTHNVSAGIATGRPADIREREREAMLGICTRCHTDGMARRGLLDADAIEVQSRALVEEAREIVEALGREGLLRPSPAERDPHPLLGKTLAVGPHMLYEGLSSVEAKLFRMKKFYYITAYKGAMHQNPDYAHWFGNAPLKLALSEIKSEAELLREVARIEMRLDNLAREGFGGNSTGAAGVESAGQLKRALRELNDRLLRKEITPEQHMKEKNRLLDSMGL